MSTTLARRRPVRRRNPVRPRPRMPAQVSATAVESDGRILAVAAAAATMLVLGRRDSPGTLDWGVGGLTAIVAL
ncbi:hypothetical protein [Rhodococcus sp. WAY2]|uniref:hypothetical protein n=1 Tax=Rhodococcus sp. WAY2 TaxID=2663121 RepID=UPI0013581783|nr:hypothetical protein [Rhodococcus sp. WAY2]